MKSWHTIGDPLNTKQERVHHQGLLGKGKKDAVSITSYVVPSNKGVKNVLILSAMCPILGIPKGDGKQKPAVFKLYYFTNGGTDQTDQQIGNYSSKTNSSKWT